MDCELLLFFIEFPNSKGEFQRFSVFEASVMHPDLQAKYPNIKSYAGKGIDDPTATIRLSIVRSIRLHKNSVLACCKSH